MATTSQEGGCPVRDGVEQESANTDGSVTRATRERLAELGNRPTADHVAVFDEIHRHLVDALSEVEDRSGPGTDT
ncbi:hypothetical protein RIF23_04195 [Lipingzhangella sp. LS1_29]|uniref:Uncharacterized protein n=1 Tax=Lipingzhangella rawalii TaxID=2055835 RepID=A0ABU2H3T9_9ACTN|nr:hypothetical protein [Lipingzhangella rawalii]MDS1269495.1 hypothetical protein [Lipingzhangella rawalii]